MYALAVVHTKNTCFIVGSKMRTKRKKQHQSFSNKTTATPAHLTSSQPQPSYLDCLAFSCYGPKITPPLDPCLASNESECTPQRKVSFEGPWNFHALLKVKPCWRLENLRRGNGQVNQSTTDPTTFVAHVHNGNQRTLEPFNLRRPPSKV